MTIAPVQMVGPQDQVKTTSGRKGGSRTGQIIGGIIGGAAGAAAGTVAAPGAGTIAGGIAGAGGGASLGGTIGDMISPGKQESTAVTRRIQSSGPQLYHSDRSEQIKQSLMALHSQPAEIQQQYAPPLTQAYIMSLAQDNQTGVA